MILHIKLYYEKENSLEIHVENQHNLCVFSDDHLRCQNRTTHATFSSLTFLPSCFFSNYNPGLPPSTKYATVCTTENM